MQHGILAAKGGIANFVEGSSQFSQCTHIPEILGTTLISVMVISFAATSLDTATRIQRLILGELGNAYEIKILKKPLCGFSPCGNPCINAGTACPGTGKGPGIGRVFTLAAVRRNQPACCRTYTANNYYLSKENR